MDRLPIELLDKIISHVSRTDLACLRLVSKACGLAAGPLLFKHISICWFSFSLSKLSSIASAPSLAQHVRQLTIYTNGLQARYPSFKEFKHYMSKVLIGDLKKHSTRPSDEDWLSAFKAYESFVWQQGKPLNSQLKAAIRPLSNLVEINVANLSIGPRFPPSASFFPWERSTLDTIRELIYHSALNFLPHDQDIINAVLDAIALRSQAQERQIRALSIDARIDDSIFPSLTTRNEMSSPKLSQIFTGLQDLRSFSLWPTWTGFLSPRKDWDLNKRLISSFSNLEHVTLVLIEPHAPGSPDMAEYATFTSMLGTVHWPRLVSLRLTVHVTNADLLAFFSAHSKTLKSLAIRDTRFNNVPLVLKQIPLVLSLSDIYLGDLFSWDDFDVYEQFDRCYFINGTMTPTEHDWLLTGRGPEPEWQALNISRYDVLDKQEHVWVDWTSRGRLALPSGERRGVT